MERLQWITKFPGKFDDELDFLETILKSYGVENIQEFLKPSTASLNDPFMLGNMETAVRLLHDNLDKKKVIKVDCDVDGYTSAVLLAKFLKKLNPDAEINFLFSFEKQHGLTMNKLSNLPKDDVGFILIPDASMTCKDARMIQSNYHVPILVLDHHIVETEYLDKLTNKWISREEAEKIREKDKDRIEEDCYTNYCVSVNNNDSDYPNKTLSGVGVVAKFIEAYCSYYKLDSSWICDYYDLISTGMIADGMDLTNPETRWYVLKGLEKEFYHNEFLNEIEDRLKDDIGSERTITNIGWVIAPRINAVCRYGTEEEQVNMFRAFVGEQEEIEYQPRRKHKTDPKPPVEIHSLQWELARVACNAKSRQDTDVRKFMTQVEEKIAEQNLLENSVLFIDCTSLIDKKSVTGLVANKLKSKYFRPVIIMKEKNSQEFGGSGRGYEDGEIKNLNEFLSEFGVTCLGHSNAFGINLKKADLPEIIKKCNRACPVDDIHQVIRVDWEIPANKLTNEHVKSVASNYAIWGNTAPNPTFAITNIEINAANITGIGENNRFIKFTYNGVTYVKKYCTKGEYENMTLKTTSGFGPSKKNLRMNVIVQFQNNEYDGKLYPEAKILYYDVEENFDFVPIEDINITKIVDNVVETTTNVSASKADEIDIDNFVW